MKKTSFFSTKNKRRKIVPKQPKQLRKLKKTTRSRWQLRFLSRRAVKLKAMKNRRQLLSRKRRRRQAKYRNDNNIKRLFSQRKYRYLVAPQRVTVTRLPLLVHKKTMRSYRAFYRQAKIQLRFRARRLRHAASRGFRIYFKRRRHFLRHCKKQLRVKRHLHRTLPLHRSARRLSTSYYLATAKYRLRRRSSSAAVMSTLARFCRLRARLHNPQGVFVWRKRRLHRRVLVSREAATPTAQSPAETRKPVISNATRRAIARRRSRWQRLRTQSRRKMRKHVRPIKVVKRPPAIVQNPRRRVSKDLQRQNTRKQDEKIRKQKKGRAHKKASLRFLKLLKLGRARRLRLYRRNIFTQPLGFYRPRVRRYLSTHRLTNKRRNVRRQRRTVFMRTRRSRSKLRKYGQLRSGPRSVSNVFHKLVKALKKHTILRKRKKQLPRRLSTKRYLRIRRRNIRRRGRRARKLLRGRRLRRNAPWKKLLLAFEVRRKRKALVSRKPKVLVRLPRDKKWKRRWLRRKRRALRRSLRRRQTRKGRFALRHSGVAKYRFRPFRRTLLRFPKRTKRVPRIFKKLRTRSVAQRAQWLRSITKTTRRLNAFPLVQQYLFSATASVKDSTLATRDTYSTLPCFRASMRSRARIFRRCRRRRVRLLRLRRNVVARKRRRLRRKVERRRRPRLPTKIFRRRKFRKWLRRKKYKGINNFAVWGNFRIWWILRHRERYGRLSLRKDVSRPPHKKAIFPLREKASVPVRKKAKPPLRALIKRHIRKLSKMQKAFKKILQRRKSTCNQFFVGFAHLYKRNKGRKTVRRAVLLKPIKIIRTYSVRKNRLLRLAGRFPRVVNLHLPRPRRFSTAHTLLRAHSKAFFASNVTRKFSAQNKQVLRVTPYSAELRGTLQAVRTRQVLRARKVSLCRRVRKVSARFKRFRRLRSRLRRYRSQRWLVRQKRRQRQVLVRLAGHATRFRNSKKFWTWVWRRKPISVDDYYKWQLDCRDHKFDMKLMSMHVMDDLENL
jgi:hypothetical protein